MKFINKTLLIYFLFFTSLLGLGQTGEKEKLPIGYWVYLEEITEKKLKYAKSVGIDYIEVSNMNLLVGEDGKLKMTEEEIALQLRKIKKAAETAGIKIWSVHMPFGEKIDISLPTEKERREVVLMHKKLLKHIKILEPEVILFHPSHFFGRGERNLRIGQMIKSAKELNNYVKQIDAMMVIENMLGPTLLKNSEKETPLLRTVEEAVAIMNKLPKDIYSAIDMNHIKNPEELILAMGDRLKSLHVADGKGKVENHYHPCSGEGSNDWMKILAALEQVNYNGPFMFESYFADEEELTQCYEELYNEYINKD